MKVTPVELAQMSNGQLLLAFQGGNRDAIKQFIVRVISNLLGTMTAHCKACGHPYWAEDICQEVLLRVINEVEKHNKAGTRVPNLRDEWLAKVGRNVCTDWLRRERHKSTARKVRSDREDHAGELRRERELTREQVKVLIARLRPRDAEILRLIYLDDLTFQQAAAALGLKVPACRKREDRAMTSLHDLQAADPELERRILGPL